MEITKEQYAKIEGVLPVQRGNVALSNLQLINALLYMTEHGCKWRALPDRFGKWHTVYTRINRWSKTGVLDRLFERLQAEKIVRVRIEAFTLEPPPRKALNSAGGAFQSRTRMSYESVSMRGASRFIWLPKAL
jgi:transposase